MAEPSDVELVRRGAQGDECAFVELVRRYEPQLARLIRYQVGHPQHAEDVLQETLVQAWVDLRTLREPHRVRSWLLQVARNRCRDFFKSSQRRERPTEAQDLEHYLNRAGRVLSRQGEAVARVVEALEEVPTFERDLIRSFYLEGQKIAEIAARHRYSEGAVKRRLFHARNHLREVLEIIPGERKIAMSTRRQGVKRQPFPGRRPEIRITESRAQPFAIDCRELRWWFGLPEIGDCTLWATYDPPEWRLSGVTEMDAQGPAEIHGLEGVEVEVNQWEPETGWQLSTWTMYGRLTEDAVQWLATVRLEGDQLRLYTLMDEYFDQNWGSASRRIEDRGRFALQEDGSFQQQNQSPEALGAGMYSLRIGDRKFTCLRVLDVEEEPAEEGILVEAFLTRQGRTVLFRRYNGRLWGKSHGRPPWDEALPDHARLVIDGVVFVHWYDCLTGLACGI